MTTARVRSIAQLPPAGQLDGTEALPVVQQGQTVATTTGAVARLGGGTGGGGGPGFSGSANDIVSGTLDAARLPASGVTAGTYGSGSLVPVLTVDATGRLTGIATAPVSGGGSGGGSSPLSMRHQVLTPTNGQTVFTVSGGYTAGNLIVFIDGYAALAGTDYTATNGTTVTISSPALDTSDRVEFVLFDGGGSSGSGPANTDALPEGTTNVYFTTARARAAISVSGSLAYSAATGIISYTAPTPYTLPAATAGALGGVKANAGTSGQFVAGLAADGSLIYATPAGGGSGGGPTSTDQLTEGTTNLYFTQARARASVSAAGSLSYSAATGVFTAPTLAAVATSGSASDLTAGTLPVARLPAHTGDATSAAGSAALTLATVNTNVGTFNSLTVNGKGQVTAATAVAYLTANQTITLSGDVAGSGSTAITATLANTAVTAGTYTNATLTVDAKGRLTAASSGSAGGTGTVTSSGTPTSGQLALFTTATNVQGVTVLPAANYPALTGDVTSTAGSLATTIAAGVVTYAKLATAAIATAASDVWANVANKVLTAAAVWLAHAPVTWAYAATYTPDMSTFLTATMTLTGNLTLANPTNAKPGQAGEIVLTQDGTGSRVVSYGSSWKFAGGTPTASTAAGAIDVISYRVVTSSLIVCSFGKGVT